MEFGLKNCSKMLAEVLGEYTSTKEAEHLPTLKLHYADLLNEAFQSHYERGVLSIYGNNDRSHVYGISQMRMANNSGHMAENLGNFLPRFPLRPLWLGSQCKLIFPSGAIIYLPKILLSIDAYDAAFWLSRRTLEGGYNALLFGAFNASYAAQSTLEEIYIDDELKGQLQSIFSYIRDIGIHLIFKPDFSFLHDDTCIKSPFDSNFCHLLEQSIKAFFACLPIEYIFWESMLLGSNFRCHAQAEEATQLEVVVEELHLLERCLSTNQKLIFYIPAHSYKSAARHAWWFSTLLDEMGSNTIFSFSAVAGDIYNDLAGDHPFWQLLRTSPDTSATRLLPILNLGLFKQGEGLWPSSNNDLLDRFIPRMRMHSFCGVISLWAYLPKIGSMHDCNFWTAGMILWRDLPSQYLAETWFSALHPNKDFYTYWQLMKNVRSISLEISRLRLWGLERGRGLWTSDDARLLAELLLAKLKAMQFETSVLLAQQVKSTKPTLADAFPFFIADTVRFLHHLMPMLSMSVVKELNFEHDGFWSCAIKDRGGSLAVQFPTEPFCGPTGSIMEGIYTDNRVQLINS